jgi:hypothetical protein
MEELASCQATPPIGLACTIPTPIAADLLVEDRAKVSNIANHSAAVPVRYLNRLECGVTKYSLAIARRGTLKMHGLLRRQRGQFAANFMPDNPPSISLDCYLSCASFRKE